MALWGVLWRTKTDAHVMWREGRPLVFVRRKDAARWIQREYGYIRTRQDLRRAPHWWRMPTPVRVTVHVTRAA